LYICIRAQGKKPQKTPARGGAAGGSADASPGELFIDARHSCERSGRLGESKISFSAHFPPFQEDIRAVFSSAFLCSRGRLNAASLPKRLLTKANPIVLFPIAPVPRALHLAVRKKRRYKPGTLALKEIRKFQKSTELLLRKAPFCRLVREISNEVSPEPFRYTAESLLAIQEATEDFLVHLFEVGG
jgi:histone H3/H4